MGMQSQVGARDHIDETMAIALPLQPIIADITNTVVQQLVVGCGLPCGIADGDGLGVVSESVRLGLCIHHGSPLETCSVTRIGVAASPSLNASVPGSVTNDGHRGFNMLNSRRIRARRPSSDRFDGLMNLASPNRGTAES